MDKSHFCGLSHIKSTMFGGFHPIQSRVFLLNSPHETFSISIPIFSWKNPEHIRTPHSYGHEYYNWLFQWDEIHSINGVTS